MKLIVFLAFMLPQMAVAQLIITKVLGASNYNIDKNQNVTIFGGSSSINSGSECMQQTLPIDGLFETCNSCINQLQSCNTKRISNELILRIFFTVPSLVSSGNILITTEQGQEIEQSIHAIDQTISADQAAVAYIEWADICQAAGGFCSDSSSNQIIKIGVDTDEDGRISNEEGGSVTIKVQNPNIKQDANLSTIDCTKGGLCNFKTLSGNQKIFIVNVKKASQFPSWSGSVFNKLKVFYSTSGFNKTTPLSESTEFSASADNLVNTEFSVSTLDNGKQYYFRLAAIDEANNIAFITPDEQIQSLCGGLGTLNPAQCALCPYCNTPESITGILEKDLNCFISTVAYGSNQSFLVKFFRKFRNKVLLKFSLGIWLTKQYYHWGSKASWFIKKYPVLKFISQIILLPLAVFAWLILYFKYVFLFLSLFCFFIFLKRFKTLSLFLFVIAFLTSSLKQEVALAKLKSQHSFYKSKPTYNFYSFQIGQYTPLNLRGGLFSYAEVYGSNKNVMFLLSYEKNLSSSFGLWSLELGSGLLINLTYGIKKRTLSNRSHEKILFFLTPNHLSLIYRFQYSANPLISPYVKAGITAFGIIENPQSSGAKIKLALAPASHFATGLGINLINWSSSKKELHNDYNMHSFFIFAEYKIYKKLSKKFDLSSQMLSLGLSLGF